MLKRCLQLVEDDLSSSSLKQTKQKSNKKHKTSTIFDLIPEQKRLTITKKVGKSQIKRKFFNKTSTFVIFYQFNF